MIYLKYCVDRTTNFIYLKRPILWDILILDIIVISFPDIFFPFTFTIMILAINYAHYSISVEVFCNGASEFDNITVPVIHD